MLVQLHSLIDGQLCAVEFEDVSTITIEDDRSIMVTERNGTQTFYSGISPRGNPIGHQLTLVAP